MVLAYHIRLAGWRQVCGLWFHVWLREDNRVVYEVDNIILCGKTSNVVLIHCTYLKSFICITNCRKSKGMGHQWKEDSYILFFIKRKIKSYGGWIVDTHTYVNAVRVHE
jgi:hypothetical protein